MKKKETAEKKVEEKMSEELEKQEAKQLKTFFAVLGGILLFFFVAYLVILSLNNFTYKGADFKMVKEGDLIFYNTNFPVYNVATGKKVGDYNFYFRNDPRELDKSVLMEGDIIFRKNIVFDLTTENLFCDGDWNLAMGNIAKLNLFGINVLIKNQSQIYLPANEFMFITINQGNQTEIKQTDENSYEMNVNNCEILPAAERFMIEAITRNNELNN